MANLLVLSSHPNRELTFPSGMFVFHQLRYASRYFERIHVISAVPWIPRILSPLGRRWPRVAEVTALQDYSYGNVDVTFARYKPWAGHLPMSRQVAAIYPILLRIIRRRQLKFDLVHAHMSGNGWYAAEIARDFGVRSVLTVHDNHDTLMQLLRRAEPEIVRGYREVTEMIRVSPFDIADIERVSGPRRIHYIPNGFDASKVPVDNRRSLREQLGLPQDRPILVSVATWSRRKDPVILLESLRRILAAGRKPPPLWVFVGSLNGAADDIHRKIAESDLGRHVVLPGGQRPEDVLRYMKASDAVVLFSHSEGNPTVMFEALGCGRPYIGSDVGGVRSVLTDGRLGLYGPPGNVETVIRLVGEALERTWDEDYICHHAARYTWESVVQQTYREVYQPLLTRA